MARSKILYTSDPESEDEPETAVLDPIAPILKTFDETPDDDCGISDSELNFKHTYKPAERVPRKPEILAHECAKCGRIYKRQICLSKHKCPPNLAPRPPRPKTPEPQPEPPQPAPKPLPAQKRDKRPEPRIKPKPHPNPPPPPPKQKRAPKPKKQVIVYESSSDDYSSSDEEPEIVYRKRVPYQHHQPQGIIFV